MTSEAFVRVYYPTARTERQRTNGGKTYYLIRSSKVCQLGDGVTKARAWANAAARIRQRLGSAQ